MTRRSTNRPVPSAQWAAGFLDGEGCIHLAKQRFKRKRRGKKFHQRRPTFRLRLDCVQNNREVLLHLRSVLGPSGRLYELKRRIDHNRQLYMLTYDGVHALNAIKKVLPHLIRKQPEAEVAVQYEKAGWMGVHPGPRGYPPEVWAARERIYRKLQDLK